METPTFGVLIAFSAGLLSFLSPCVLPLIPSYVTFITGLSLDDVQHARKAALTHGMLFVLGLAVFGERLGAAGAIGALLLLAALVVLTRGQVRGDRAGGTPHG